MQYLHIKDWVKWELGYYCVACPVIQSFIGPSLEAEILAYIRIGMFSLLKTVMT